MRILLILEIAVGVTIGGLFLDGIHVIAARIAMNMATQELKDEITSAANLSRAAATDRAQAAAHAEYLRAKQADATLAASKNRQPPRPLRRGEKCVSGTIVLIDYEKKSAVQVLENSQPVMCGS